MAWGVYQATPVFLVMLGFLYQMFAPTQPEGWTGLVWSILRRR